MAGFVTIMLWGRGDGYDGVLTIMVWWGGGCGVADV